MRLPLRITDEARAEAIEASAARAALARDNVRAAYLYAIADCLRGGTFNTLARPASGNRITLKRG